MDSYEELLIQAIGKNDFKCLQYCLLKGANPNKICPCGRTPLGVAAQNGNLAILRILTESQKSIVAHKSNNHNSLSEQRKTLNLDFVGNKQKNKNIGYFVVCKDVEENEFGEGPTPDGMEALEWDMEVTDDNSKEVCLSSTPPEARIYKWYADILNRTAIMLESPENDIARFDRYGLNALHYAVLNGHCNIAEYLIENCKEISVNQIDPDTFTPLQISVNTGDIQMVKLLLKKGANVQYINRRRHTALHLAAQEGYVDVINVLIEHGANLNAYDLEEHSPLSLAILYDHEEAAKLLIKMGTRLNHEEACGYTVLHRAVWNNLTDIAKALLEAGAKIIQSHFLLHIAIRNNNFEMVKILHKYGAIINIRDEQGQTPLMLSCIYGVYGNLQIAQYLLKNGAPSNARNDLTGLTALHICVDSIRVDSGHDPHAFQQFLELLLSYNADINASSCMGNVLFYAITVGNFRAACTLVRYGADVNLREERSFVDNLTLAKKNRNGELVKLIVYAGFNFSLLFNIKSLKTQNDDPLYDFLVYVSSRPLSLRDLCRIRTRQLLGRDLMKKIYQLPLPTMLMHYLALEEL